MPKIIICDDSMFMRNRIKSILAPLEAEVLEANNGRQCLALIASNTIDLIVIDLLMPEMTGDQVLSELKIQGISIPTIVVSADVQSSTKEECMQLGAAAFFNKPPQADALLQFAAGILHQ